MWERVFEPVVGSQHIEATAGGRLDGVPVSGVVRPGSAEEIAACLAAAREHAIAVVPAGGSSKLDCGNVSDAAALVRLETSRLNGIVELDAAEGVATVEAGVAVAELERAAREAGLRTRLPALHPGATVGGTVAADPPCPESAPGLRLRDDLLGVSVALTRGAVARAGGRVVKNVTGFDLVRLYTGSRGSLGVLTEVTLRLRPLPEARRLVVEERSDPGAALERAHDLRVGAAQPDAIAVRGAQVWSLLEGIEADVLERAAEAGGESRDPEDWSDVGDAMLPTPSDGEASVRLAARPTDTPEIVRALDQLAGSGAVRVALPLCGIVTARIPERVLDLVLERSAEAGWAAVVERASPERKRGIDVFGAAPQALPVMRALKERFDPERCLSPGRFAGHL